MTHRLPPWLKVRLPALDGELPRVAGLLRKHRLNTVCTGAKCPNLAECWACGTATIMILGRECTRNCRFCAVSTSRTPAPPDANEPGHVAAAVAELGLRYAVLTSVTRDDLPDGGAEHFARTVKAIKNRSPGTLVELLIPDLLGSPSALSVIVRSGADIVGHNLETVARTTPLCRDSRASYARSLGVLGQLAEFSQGPEVKTALLLGLGEEPGEVVETMREAHSVGVRHIALGQYLAPSSAHAPVVRYWSPAEFSSLERTAMEIGYHSVAAGPLVRSSYRAGTFAGQILRGKSQ
jgi:lipoic acid synthetase